MATLPQASTAINEQAGALSGASDYIAMFGCVSENADMTPRVFTSASALLSEHGYSQAADYAALHIAGTKKPILFCGLPIATAGALVSLNNAGVDGTSQVTITASACMEETQGELTVTTGGVVGVNGIIATLSMDGGVTLSTIRLGTGSSYTVPNLGIVINFGAGTLLAGDVVTFVTKAPQWQAADFLTAWQNLANQQVQCRSIMPIGEVGETLAGDIATAANDLASEDDRFVYARTSVLDRQPLAQMSQIKVVNSTFTSLTFADAGDTITRVGGSFLTDGFAVGMVVTVSGSVDNNGLVGAEISALTDLIMTFATVTFVAETAPITCVLTGSPSLTYAASGHTITRAGGGSFVTEGFAVGQSVTIAGTASNNVTKTITTLSGTVMTFAAGLANEGPAQSYDVSIQETETMVSWVASTANAYAAIAGDYRIDISLGRGRVESLLTAWQFRRPCAWAASVREYTQQESIPTWRKSDGPLVGWDLTDENNNIVEYDERTVGGALANLFTCFRTYANGPTGAFIAMSLTRDTDGNILSLTHNMAVTNVAQTVVQAVTEDAIGQVLVLNTDGTATKDSLQLLQERVNSQLQLNLLQDQGQGPLASSAVWTASTTDILSVANATLHGTLALVLNGTLVNIDTQINVS